MPTKRNLRVTVAAGAASLLAVGGGLASAASASAASAGVGSRVSIADSQTSDVRGATLSGAATDTPSTITANLFLAPDHASELTWYAQQVSTPGTALYGHYLSASQARAEFAPTAAEANAVIAWAKQAGLTVDNTLQATDGTVELGSYVEVTGPASVIQSAFDVSFGNYSTVTKSGGKKTTRKFWAPKHAASLPSSVGRDVIDITGLDDAPHAATTDDTLPPNYYVAPYTSSYYGSATTKSQAITEDPITGYATGPVTGYSNITGNTGDVPGTDTPIPTVNGKTEPWTVAGYTPAQIRGAYNVTGQYTGKGVTVAVIDAYASPTMESDANDYAEFVAAHGGSKTLDKPFAPGQYTEVQHPGESGYNILPDECQAPGDWYGEESLDVESVHGQAPNAGIEYVGAADCTDQGLGDAIAFVVNQDKATIVTDSWGEETDGSSETSTYNALFEYGATEGIGFFFSAGDEGYEDPNFEDYSDQVQSDFPDSSPYVTAVGGTSLAIGKAKNYEWETGWGTLIDPLETTNASGTTSAWAFPADDQADIIDNGYYDGSSGGGVSAVFTEPWYQKGVVPNSLAETEVKSTPVYGQGNQTSVIEGYNESLVKTSTPMRVTPDVSALADPSTGFLVGETLAPTSDSGGNPVGTPEFLLSRIGGTSLASPTFAGIEADAQQALDETTHSHTSIGFANPSIYKLDATASASAFHDVTDTPGGSRQYEVRANLSDSYLSSLVTAANPAETYLRLLGDNGYDGTVSWEYQDGSSASDLATIAVTSASALVAGKGYDDETGVGSPDDYVSDYGNAALVASLKH